MKNIIHLPFLAIFMSLLFFSGCSNNAEKNQINFDLIVSEKRLPANFYEIAYERKDTPFFQYLVRKTVNQSGFEDTWNLFAFENKLPNVNLNEKDVYFIGVHESGSCPSKIKDIKLSAGNKTMLVPLEEPAGACTSDATPRTFVIQIDKEKSNDIESIVIVQSGVETSVPFENSEKP